MKLPKKIKNTLFMVSLTILSAFTAHFISATLLHKPIDWTKLLPITAILCFGIASYTLRK